MTFTVNGQGSGFTGPSFDGFRVLSGPNQSTNQSYSIVNGQVTRTYQVTYTYYLQALKAGKHEIAPATINIKGKKVRSNTLTINVVKSSQAISGSSGQASANNQVIGDDDVFIRAAIDKKKPYQGEQVIITYKIYTKIPISQLNIEKLS